jgi:hypothetical protein
MARQRFRDTDPVEEMLRIALENQGGADLSLRQRLLASASELGISEEAALAAEQQWKDQHKQEEELEQYRAHVRWPLYTHAGLYAVINTFLVLLNLLTDHGRVDWAYYVILAWGIGLGSHLVAAWGQLKHPQGEEFEAWKNSRQQTGKVKPAGITIGVHIPAAPKPVDRDTAVDRNQTQA